MGLIGPPGSINADQQLTPRRWHLVPLDAAIAEVNALAIQRVLVAHDGGVTDAADPLCPTLPRTDDRHDDAADCPALDTWQPLP
jgi:hypothetical protein